MFDFNIALASDSYKATQAPQYPKGMTKLYSHFLSRGKPAAWEDEIVFFGLQPKLARLAERVTVAQVREAFGAWREHFGGAELFPLAEWLYIAKELEGRLPVSIRAVPEGTIVGVRNVMMTVESTGLRLPSLTNWLETDLVQTWYPITVATQSREMKKVIAGFLETTGDPSLIDFKLHDFGFRGCTCYEQAALGGMAHLVNFQGTDTMAGPMAARQHYGADMAGFSIPASEHSTITSWGEEGEADAFRNMLETFPAGLVACVSDSYDIQRAIREHWHGLKDLILSRDGTLVVRPDSGYPVESVMGVLGALRDVFGTTTNDKGFMVLPSQVRMIQGDGIDFAMLYIILAEMQAQGWSADNIAFGSGGGLLQKLNRDTLQFAFKASYCEGDGWERDVFKSPVGMASKASQGGRFKLLIDVQASEEAGRTRYRSADVSEPGEDQMVEVFRDGEVLVEHTFDEIRGRAAL